MNQAIHYNQIEFDEVEAEQFKEDILDRANIEHTIIAGQRGKARIEQIHGPAFSFDRGHYNFSVVARGQFAPGCLCIGVAQGARNPTWINGYSMDYRRVMIFHEGTDVFYRADAAGGWAGLTVTREQLQTEALRLLGRELRLSSRQHDVEILRANPEAVTRLLRLASLLTPQRGEVRLQPEDFNSLLLGAYVEVVAAADPRLSGWMRERAARRLDILRRADTMMRHLVGQPYSSARLCRELGVSERTLEIHFQEALGTSPKNWSMHLALHQARRELQRRPPSRRLVTSVALDCGLRHLSRFSKSYRNLFGELPSETARQAQR